MPMKYTAALAYIGFRTTAYGPVEITFWSFAISTVAEPNEFSLNTRNTIHIPTRIRRSPAMESHDGTFDQPKRWSSAGTLIVAITGICMHTTMIFWMVRFSAVGPYFVL